MCDSISLSWQLQNSRNFNDTEHQLAWNSTAPSVSMKLWLICYNTESGPMIVADIFGKDADLEENK